MILEIIAAPSDSPSQKATDFRKWATSILKEYLIKGFTLDDDMDFDNLTQLYRNTLEFKDSIESLINYIDINTTYKDIMITNIKKYTRQFHPEQFHFGPA